MKPLLNQLRTAVKASRRTRADIARHARIGQPHLCHLMHRRQSLSIEKAQDLAAALGLEIIVRPIRRKKGRKK